MGVHHKKGDVVKTKINGAIVNCIVLSDFIEEFEISNGINHLEYPPAIRANKGGYEIHQFTPEPFFIYDCFLVLIGDQKVYVEFDEIWN